MPRGEFGWTGPDKPDKGHKGGSCNRTACQEDGATWYNRATDAWYCPGCAAKINYWSKHDHSQVICKHDPTAEDVDE